MLYESCTSVVEEHCIVFACFTCGNMHVVSTQLTMSSVDSTGKGFCSWVGQIETVSDWIGNQVHKLKSIISQKLILFITTAVRTSNPTSL
jgi:hypothetical protein